MAPDSCWTLEVSRHSGHVIKSSVLGCGGSHPQGDRKSSMTLQTEGPVCPVPPVSGGAPKLPPAERAQSGPGLINRAGLQNRKWQRAMTLAKYMV